jgi:hypothetical protein
MPPGFQFLDQFHGEKANRLSGQAMVFRVVSAVDPIEKDMCTLNRVLGYGATGDVDLQNSADRLPVRKIQRREGRVNALVLSGFMQGRGERGPVLVVVSSDQ